MLRCPARAPYLTLLAIAAAPPAEAQHANPTQARGVWQTDGYGLVVEIADTSMTMYQTTSISCMRWWTARRIKPDGGAAVFDRGDALVRFTPDSVSGDLRMREGPTISSMRLKAIGARPPGCDSAPPNTPRDNYAVFWQSFAEQFALFPRYQVDWDAVDRKYRPRVTGATTDEELFAILREMIHPFHNAHINLSAPSIGRRHLGYRTDSEIGRWLDTATAFSISQLLERFNRQARQTGEIVEQRYAGAPLQSLANHVIQFGRLPDSIGYVRLLAMSGFTPDGIFEKEVLALDEALDGIFRHAFAGLILDVRQNIGGSDPHALSIASRLTGSRYLAFSKVTRNNLTGPLTFTDPQPAWVEVSARPGFRGQVVVLLGPDAISGGETFAMALMGRSPAVTYVGENTQGVFSDVWGRKLPNGWTFGLPTELYLTVAGKSFDADGVPPDIRVAVFPRSDLMESRDGALEKALELLRRPR